ncbi:putative baseplate assembly protein [Mangrovimicrobium sediminis]|uniref:Putative baseplate assembly protein n=1 Tax=Mangrovimicrobium sediminis TaxID=2562682 RepID=A0A4Z0MA50_9GAMM|nr:putative baseplate assembly protein [Haliea sp. SAOS-164]TGD76175.1 putative baseplate assembly protein [Haliea sp. SAOS-164]
MPLQDYMPVIDDRSYESIVREVRSRIPRYTPEWTDLNESDPGMIIMELFAWLTEMQLYRLAQVPELHYLKFLELVGIELEPARPATAQLTLAVSAGHSQRAVIVPAKTQFSAAEADEQGRIVFETERAFTLVRANLVDLLADDGFNYRDLGNDNLDTTATFLPFGPAAVRDNSFMLGFDEELPPETLTLQAWSPIASEERVVSRCYSEVETISSTRLAFEYWNGREWRPLTLLKDDTAAFTRSGSLQLRGPASGEMVARGFGDITTPRFWLRARIDASGYEQAPRLLAVRANTFTVSQAQTYEFEALGGSNGEVDQVLRLRNAPVLAGSLVLEVDEGDDYQAWQEVPDFYGSGARDAHYVLNRTTGEVRFGNGRNGRVPVANASNRSNVRARSYHAGGGSRGNLAAQAISKLLDSVKGVDGKAVSNLFASAGGSDEQSLDDAIRRAPQRLKTRDRAVTAEDYEELALLSTNIARARALPLYHPDYPGIDVPGVVSVLVVPDVEGDAPVPSEGTVQTVCAYLNQRRLLTSELYVMGPTYSTVVVRAQLVAEDTADLAALKSLALESLDLYFHPLHGGEQSDPQLPVDDPERSGGGWPFGGDIYYSLLYRRLLFSGVKRLVSLQIELDGEIYPECSDVPLATGVLLRSGAHEIQVDYEVNS